MILISIAFRNTCTYRKGVWKMSSYTECSVQPSLHSLAPPTATVIFVLLVIRYQANTRETWIKMTFTLNSFSCNSAEEFHQMLATVAYRAKRERLQVRISYLQSCQIPFIEKLQLLCFNPVAFWTLPSRLFSHRHIYHSFMGHYFGWIPALQRAHSGSAFRFLQAVLAVYDLEDTTKICNLHSSDKNNWKRWPFTLSFW